MVSGEYLLLVDLFEDVQVSDPQVFDGHLLHCFELIVELLVLISELLDSFEGEVQQLHVEQVAERRSRGSG